MHVVIANKDDAARAGATELAAGLDRLGLEVLFDDRQASPGVKFKDAELLGVPWIVVVGRGWADGVVELRDRFSGQAESWPQVRTWPSRSWRRSGADRDWVRGPSRPPAVG